MPLTLPTSLSPLRERLLPGTDLKPPPLRTTKAAWRADLTAVIEAWCAQVKAAPDLCAALHLLNDDVERAHEIAQANEGVGACDLVSGALGDEAGDRW